MSIVRISRHTPSVCDSISCSLRTFKDRTDRNFCYLVILVKTPGQQGRVGKRKIAQFVKLTKWDFDVSYLALLSRAWLNVLAIFLPYRGLYLWDRAPNGRHFQH